MISPEAATYLVRLVCSYASEVHLYSLFALDHPTLRSIIMLDSPPELSCRPTALNKIHALSAWVIWSLPDLTYFLVFFPFFGIPPCLSQQPQGFSLPGLFPC